MHVRNRKIIADVLDATHFINPESADVLTRHHQVHGRVAIFEYDFADLGGVVGDINLNGLAFPGTDFMMDRILVNAITAPTSGGSATIAIVLGGTTVLSATAFDNTLFNNTANLKRITLSAPVKITARTTNKITIATAALTAGRFMLYVPYGPTVVV